VTIVIEVDGNSIKWAGPPYWIREKYGYISFIFQEKRHSRGTEQDRYGGVPWWCMHLPCGYRHHIFTCHKYDITERAQTRPFKDLI